MSDFLKDMMLRALLAAVVGSLVAGGVVWFAFDQSLRGVETTLTTMNARIDDTNALFEGVGDRFDRMDDRFDRMEQRVDQINAGLDDMALQTHGKLDRILAILPQQDARLREVEVAASATDREIAANLMAATDEAVKALNAIEAALSARSEVLSDTNPAMRRLMEARETYGQILLRLTDLSNTLSEISRN